MSELQKLLKQRDELNRLINKLRCQKYNKTPPTVKRPYTYYTMTTFRENVVRHIASEWWGIDTNGKSKARLMDEILDAQDSADERVW